MLRLRILRWLLVIVLNVSATPSRTGHPLKKGYWMPEEDG